MMRWAGRKLLPLVAVAAVTLSSIGAASAQKQDSTPFKLMIMVGINVFTGNYPEIPPAAAAAAEVVNKQGGLGGRPIQVIPCNMLGTAAGAGACAQTAADQNVDWVYFNHGFETSVVPILNANDIPYAGSKVSTSIELRDPNLYPMTPPATLNAAAPAYEAVKEMQARGIKHPTLAFLVLDTPTAGNVINYVRQVVLRAGGAWKGIVPIGATSTDYASAALALKQLNPDIVGNAVTAAQQAGVMTSANQFGLNPVWALAGGVGGQVVPTLPFTVHAYLGRSTPFDIQPKYPGAAKIRADEAAGGDTDPAAYGELGAQGWLDVIGLQKLAKLVKGPVTKDSMLATLRKTANITLVPGIHWTPTLHGPVGFKNLANGHMWVSKWDPTSKTFVGTNLVPIDIFQELGIGKTPSFPDDKYPTKS